MANTKASLSKSSRYITGELISFWTIKVAQITVSAVSSVGEFLDTRTSRVFDSSVTL